MTNEFCDWEPCHLLQKLIKKFALKPGDAPSTRILMLRPGNRAADEPPQVLTLYYCPFCGTRISDNKEILDWLVANGRRT